MLIAIVSDMLYVKWQTFHVYSGPEQINNKYKMYVQQIGQPV